MCLTNVAPSIAPMDVSIDRTSPIIMVVSWTPLSYVEARGFISNYTVAYSPQTSGRNRRQAIVQTVDVPGMDSSTVTIANLDPDIVYSVQVSATTGGGTSESSVPVLAELPDEGDHMACLSYIDSDLSLSRAQWCSSWCSYWSLTNCDLADGDSCIGGHLCDVSNYISYPFSICILVTDLNDSQCNYAQI